jgi:hypothetical protein
MESWLKFFKLFLIITIFFDAVLSTVGFYLLTKYIPQLRSDTGILVLLSSAVFFMISAFFVLFLLKRYPSQPISNTAEGFVFTVAIITFLLSLVDLLLIYTFFDIAIDLQNNKKNLVTTVLLFISVPSVIAVASAVFIAINSFKLLKIIRKNRWNLAQQIKNIGTENEPDASIGSDS